MTTNHVWEGLRKHVTVDELRDYWAPISPIPYVERGMGATTKSFLVYGKYDPTMLPELSRQMLDSLRRHGAASPQPATPLRPLLPRARPLSATSPATAS